jgi:4-hydroxy-3-polyprenylbenzoate decarboxylase
MYRMQVYDDQTTGMHFQIHKHAAKHEAISGQKGQRLEMAVAIGADPVSIYAATAPCPDNIDEFLLAGFIRKEPVELVKCETVNLEVPAHAEIILEGYIDPAERRIEGPFGDHTGFYSLAEPYPVFHITCITHRKDAIYPATVVGRPIMEDFFLGDATVQIFLPLIQTTVPEIVDMYFPPEGIFHNCCIVSIKKSYPGQAKKVMHALWGLGQMMFTKLIVVVDESVHVRDLSEVAWVALNSIDARRDLVIVDGPLDDLDRASPVGRYGSKMGIDATTKTKEEGMPREWGKEITMPAEIKALVDKRWKEYGL